jgi:hypothetical protein
MMTRNGRARWKSVERAIAEHLGGQRVPVSGRTRGWAPDVQHSWLAIEVKSRKSMLLILAEMMDQAKKAAVWAKKHGQGDKLPIGVYHVTGTRIENAYVFMRLGDFQEYFGDLPGEATSSVGEGEEAV